MADERPRYKRSVRNFLLDRRFQLKYTLFIVLSGGLLFGTMEGLFYDEVRQNSELAVLDPGDEFSAGLREELAAEDRKVLLILVSFWLALVAALFVVGITATHRIVGPLYVMDRYIRRIRDGHAVYPRPLRQGDEFQTLYQHVNEMAESLRNERTSELEALTRCLDRVQFRLDSMRGTPDLAELATGLEADLAVLRELVDKKREWLGLPDVHTGQPTPEK